MEVIGKQWLWTFLSDTGSIRPTTSNTQIRKAPGRKVRSFLELTALMADLQFNNRDYVLLFRGQDQDYLNKAGNTTLKPELFRRKGRGNPGRETLIPAFERLRRCEEELVRAYSDAKFVEPKRLARQQILRWAILQHYQVCATPLLDVTQSLRVAASFATHGNSTEYGYLFVIGVPNISGAVTASAEAGIQIVRLASACPPSALRPHVQQGYLLGEYPDMQSMDQKSHYAADKIDFGLRLIAKFQLCLATFWKSASFPIVSELDLYPQRDRLNTVAGRVKNAVGV
jgi:hypothetical protein